MIRTGKIMITPGPAIVPEVSTGATGWARHSRGRELDQLRVAVLAVAGGYGRVVLVEGEAGIGKSACLALLADEARHHGCRVLHAAADELISRLPLRLAVEAIGLPLSSFAGVKRARRISRRQAVPSNSSDPLLDMMVQAVVLPSMPISRRKPVRPSTPALTAEGG